MGFRILNFYINQVLEFDRDLDPAIGSVFSSNLDHPTTGSDIVTHYIKLDGTSWTYSIRPYLIYCILLIIFSACRKKAECIKDDKCLQIGMCIRFPGD